MRQFQGSLGPIQDLQPKHPPGVPKPSKAGWRSKLRADPETSLLWICIGLGAGVVACVLRLAGMAP